MEIFYWQATLHMSILRWVARAWTGASVMQLLSHMQFACIWMQKIPNREIMSFETIIIASKKWLFRVVRLSSSLARVLEAHLAGKGPSEILFFKKCLISHFSQICCMEGIWPGKPKSLVLRFSVKIYWDVTSAWVVHTCGGWIYSVLKPDANGQIFYIVSCTLPGGNLQPAVWHCTSS